MVILRCTLKLQRRLAQEIAEPTERSTTLLGDWSGNLIRVGPRQLLLFISEKSRLPVLLPARDVKQVGRLLPRAVGEVLTALDIDSPTIAREHEEMSITRFAPTNSRSLLGSLNDFAYLTRETLFIDPERPLLQLSLELSKTPLAPFKYENPRVVTRYLFAGQ